MVVRIFPSNGHIRLFRRLGPVGVGFHKEKSLQSTESRTRTFKYPHKYPIVLCMHIDQWKCRFCRVIRVILTARDENHTTSGILRNFSSQRQISISLNTNMQQIISIYLMDNNQALKHVPRSHSPVLSAKNWFSFSRKSHFENDHRGVRDVDIFKTATIWYTPCHYHHNLRVYTGRCPSEVNIKDIIDPDAFTLLNYVTLIVIVHCRRHSIAFIYRTKDVE
jgi:hypothetical protein